MASANDYELIVNLANGVPVKDAVARHKNVPDLKEVAEALELTEAELEDLIAVLSYSDSVADVDKAIVSLASVASTYGSSHAGGRPSKSGAVGGKSKLHNAFPKPKKPKQAKTKTAFPSPAQNRANLKRALRLAREMGYTDFDPDTMELSDDNWFDKFKDKSDKKKGVKEGKPKSCKCGSDKLGKKCVCKMEDVDKKAAAKEAFVK